MQLLIDFIFNKGCFYNNQEFYYNQFGPREIRHLLSKITIPSEIFIVNGPFYISGYRKALMFSEAISSLYFVKIYGFDLLRDYSKNKSDSITINDKSFVKENNNFFIRNVVNSTTDYSLKSIFSNLKDLKLPHENILNWD